MNALICNMSCKMQNGQQNTREFKLKKAAKHTCKICFTIDRHNQVSSNGVISKAVFQFGSLDKNKNGRGKALKIVPSDEKQLCFLESDYL